MDPIVEKLTTARVGLLLKHPFFGNMATRMRMVDASDWCPTAATNGREFMYNKAFVTKLSEKKLEEWNEVAEQSIRDLVDRDYEDEFREQAREEVMDNTPEFGVNAEELKAAVEQRYEELRDAKINEIMADMGREYDEAYEEWESNEWQEMATGQTEGEAWAALILSLPHA